MTLAEKRVRDFFHALTRGDHSVRAMLTDDATFESTSPPVSGAEAVIETLLAQDGDLARRITWGAPESDGHQVRISGEAPNGSPKLGYIQTVSLDGDRISAIRQQDIRDSRMAGAIRLRAGEQPVAIPAELKQMIAEARDKNPMLVAYVDGYGQPVLSFRGSIFVLSDDQLALWIRNSEGGLVSCIATNPKVSLMYRNQSQKATFQFQGRAHVTKDVELRERIYAAIPSAEQHHDFARAGAAVVIDVDFLEGYFNLEPGWTMLTQRRTADSPHS